MLQGLLQHFLYQLLCPDDHIPLSGDDSVSLLSWLTAGLLQSPIPPRYTIIMNNRVCIQLALETWASAFLVAVTPIIAIPAHYCGHNIINHFTCEIQALLKLVCSDTPVSLIRGLVISVFTLPLPFTFILISYFCTVVAMLKIRSAEARLNTFSTCGSHVNCGHCILWDSHLNVPETSVKGISGRRQSHFNIL